MVLWSVAVVEFMEITHLIDAEIRVVLKVARELRTKDFNADHVNDNVCETFVFAGTANEVSRVWQLAKI